MGALMFFPVFLLVLGVGGYAAILALYAVYRLSGGRKKFRSWCYAMQF